MGKFSQNKELRLKLAKFVQEKYNALYANEPDKQITDKEVEDLVNDEKRVESYEKSRKLMAEREKRLQIYESVKAELNIDTKNRKNINRIVTSEIKTEDTEEAHEFNKKLVSMVYDDKKSLAYNNKCIKDLLTADAKDFLPSENIDEMFEKYEKNRVFYEKSFLVYDFVSSEDNNVLVPEMEKFVDDNKSLIQMGGYVRSMMETMANPLYLCFPDKLMDDPMMMALNMEIGNELNKEEYKDYRDEIEFDKLVQKTVGNLEGKSEKDKKTVIDEIIPGKCVSPYMSNLMINSRLRADAKNINVLFKNVSNTKDFMDKNVFAIEKDGTQKLATTNTVLDYLYDGGDAKNVKLLERSPEEIKAYKDAFNKTYCFNYGDLTKKFHEEITKLEATQAKLKKTHGIFTRDSKEFKNMEKNLKNTIKDLKKFEKNLKSPKEYGQAHGMNADKALVVLYNGIFEKHDEIKKFRNDCANYQLRKANDLKKLEAKGKTFNERTKQRLTICAELDDLYKKDIRNFELPVKEVNDLFKDNTQEKVNDSKELQDNLKEEVLLTENNLEANKEANKDMDVQKNVETFPPSTK